MALRHTGMFNKYCPQVPPSISTCKEGWVVLWLDPVRFAYTLKPCMFLLAKNVKPFIASHRELVENFAVVHNSCLEYCGFTLTWFVWFSVCSRSRRPFSGFPAHRQLPAVVLYSAFIWGPAARSHHLRGLLYCEPSWQPGKKQETPQRKIKVEIKRSVYSVTVWNWNSQILSWDLTVRNLR